MNINSGASHTVAMQCSVAHQQCAAPQAAFPLLTRQTET